MRNVLLRCLPSQQACRHYACRARRELRRRVKEATANGRLGPRGTGSHRRVVDAVAERHGIGPDAVALAAVFAQPWADVVLSGAVNEAQLRSNLEALHVEPSDADLAELVALGEPPTCTGSGAPRLPWT